MQRPRGPVDFLQGQDLQAALPDKPTLLGEALKLGHAQSEGAVSH